MEYGVLEEEASRGSSLRLDLGSCQEFVSYPFADQ